MEVLKKIQSKDGSIKYLFTLEDGCTIEALYMNHKESQLTFNTTGCISSQVGCKLACVFCATGKSGYVRNLSPEEIFFQAKILNDACISNGKERLEAVVFAGMGEPLLNYENVKMGIYQIYENLKISNFEITTVGIIQNIQKLISDFSNSDIRIRLNISLHAPTQDRRNRIIPFSTGHSLEELLAVAENYANQTNSKVRMRYMLLKGINDRDIDVENLCKILENKPFRLVVSSYNDNQIEGLEAPSTAEQMDFCEKLRHRIDVSVFNNFGSDIFAGCGQLRWILQN